MMMLTVPSTGLRYQMILKYQSGRKHELIKRLKDANDEWKNREIQRNLKPDDFHVRSMST